MNKNCLLFAVLMLSLSFCSCKKEKGVNTAIEIDETNLTVCPEYGTCEYFFSEEAKFNLNDVSNPLRKGEERIFFSGQRSSMSTYIYIMAPKKGDAFLLNKRDILNRKVIVNRNCVACYMLSSRPVDGYVKGRNLTPEKAADQSKWILEAQVIMQTEGSSGFRDTIYVKQYFYPKFINN
ncbi:hypothetical protein ACSBL2_03615 [Pedobacter sp. AW31-3R]|uniref:hypothetical protein n=1 Tax=Pedobacter sp. AW31-3R TaxID=3445781 RepID=UPI003FA0FE9E